MVLSPEIMIPPRHNSFSNPESSPPSPIKSHWWFFTSKLKLASNSGSSFGSTHTVATQKLRESKWFDQDEERLFCAVVEAGFIVEIMQKDQSPLINDGEDFKSHFGIVSIEVKKSECCFGDLFLKACECRARGEGERIMLPIDRVCNNVSRPESSRNAAGLSVCFFTCYQTKKSNFMKLAGCN